MYRYELRTMRDEISPIQLQRSPPRDRSVSEVACQRFHPSDRSAAGTDLSWF